MLSKQGACCINVRTQVQSPDHLGKKSDMGVYAYNPSTGEADTGYLWGSMVSQPSLTENLLILVREHVLKTKWTVPKDNS